MHSSLLPPPYYFTKFSKTLSRAVPNTQTHALIHGYSLRCSFLSHKQQHNLCYTTAVEMLSATCNFCFPVMEFPPPLLHLQFLHKWVQNFLTATYHRHFSIYFLRSYYKFTCFSLKYHFEIFIIYFTQSQFFRFYNNTDIPDLTTFLLEAMYHLPLLPSILIPLYLHIAPEEPELHE